MENIVLMLPDYLHGIEDSEVQQYDGVRLRDGWICLSQMRSDMYYQTKFMIQLELFLDELAYPLCPVFSHSSLSGCKWNWSSQSFCTRSTTIRVGERYWSNGNPRF